METELLVIGGGPAGYTAAIRAAQRGLDVTLVEDGELGGSCLNHGCIPSKALLSATGKVHDVGMSEEMGIYAEPYVDVSEMVGWKNGIVSQLTSGVEQRLLASGVDLIEGFARFADERTVVVDESQITFDDAIIATGSRAMTLANFDPRDEPIMDAKQALSVDRVPPRLLVIGAGYVGMELSTVFARLGSDVTVVEMMDEPLPQYDSELSRPVTEAARELGIDFEFGEAGSEWRWENGGIVVTTETDTGDSAEYDTDRVLVAIGREPVTDGLNLQAAGVTTDDRGFVETTDRGQTIVDSVYAIGDVAGEPMLAHKGSREGIVAAEVIADVEDPPERRSVPEVVFTDPEIATVGLTREEATESGLDPVVGRFPFAANGRAQTTGDASGFVRLVADGDGAVVGGQIVGPEASELIAEIGTAIDAGVSLQDLGATIHAHPTLSEATMEAAEQALGLAIHTSN